MPVMKKPGGVGPSLPAPMQGLMDTFFPADELPMDSIASPIMMAAGRAAKGLARGIKGFELPDGKVAKPVSDGVNRIFEGDEAVKTLARMREPVSKEFARNPMPPSVSHPSHLSDVAVPIPDSLDTNLAYGAPSKGRWQMDRNPAASHKAKANETIVRTMRDLYDNQGWKLRDIQIKYPEFSQPAINEIVKRMTWARVK